MSNRHGNKVYNYQTFGVLALILKPMILGIVH